MRFYLLAVLLLAGCAGKDGPITSHGKPVAHWIEELKQADPQARKKAVVALGSVGKADPVAIPALIGVIKDDSDSEVRSQAILAILNIGPDAKDAVPVLTEAESDKDDTVRSYASKALVRVRGTK